jgi:hypothetical protein
MDIIFGLGFGITILVVSVVSYLWYYKWDQERRNNVFYI